MSAPILSVESNTTVREASLYMFKCMVESLLVKENDDFVGIITETDITRKLVGEGLDPESTLVTEIMTAPLLTLSGELPILEANRFMAKNRIRRLAVILDEKIVGMLSLKNRVNYYANSLGTLAAFLCLFP